MIFCMSGFNIQHTKTPTYVCYISIRLTKLQFPRVLLTTNIDREFTDKNRIVVFQQVYPAMLKSKSNENNVYLCKPHVCNIERV